MIFLNSRPLNRLLRLRPCGQGHLLNLIDTPGHVDFSGEVARSLAVCDGILFLVAANAGVQVRITKANMALISKGFI